MRGSGKSWFTAASVATFVAAALVLIYARSKTESPSIEQRVHIILKELRKSYRRFSSTELYVRTFLTERGIYAFPNPPKVAAQRKDLVRELAALGDEAVPVLVDALRDTKPSLGVYYALRELGPASVTPLSAALKDSDPAFRANAAMALIVIGPQAKSSVPALTEALNDPNSKVRRLAAGALGSVCADKRASLKTTLWPVKAAQSPFDANDENAVLALSLALKDRTYDVRKAAYYALSRFGTHAKAALPALLEGLDDPDVRTRKLAALVVASRLSSPGVGPHAKAAVPALIRGLRHSDPELRAISARALGAIGPGARDGVASLIVNLRDSDRGTRRCAAEALGKIGPGAKSAVPALIMVLRDPDDTVKASAACALGEIGPDAKAAVPGLIVALREGEQDLRWNAAQALGRIGPLAKDSVPGLIVALEDSDWYIRQKAAEALGELGASAKAAIPALKEALKDKVEDVRKAAAEALEKTRKANNRTRAVRDR